MVNSKPQVISVGKNDEYIVCTEGSATYIFKSDFSLITQATNPNGATIKIQKDGTILITPAAKPAAIETSVEETLPAPIEPKKANIEELFLEMIGQSEADIPSATVEQQKPEAPVEQQKPAPVEQPEAKPKKDILKKRNIEELILETVGQSEADIPSATVEQPEAEPKKVTIEEVFQNLLDESEDNLPGESAES